MMTTTTHSKDMKLPATTKTVSQEVYEATNTRGKFRKWVEGFNNCNFLGYTKNGYARVLASPFVVDGPNGLRANGFWCVCTNLDTSEGYAVGTYIVKRDKFVTIEQPNEPGEYTKTSEKARYFYTCKNEGCGHTWVEEGPNVEHPAKKACPKCEASEALKPKKLDSYYSAKGHVCNSACMGATGHVCVCGCGGKNHGVWHMG